MNILKIFSISVILTFIALAGQNWNLMEFVISVVAFSFLTFLVWIFWVRCFKPASVALLSFWNFLDRCLKPASIALLSFWAFLDRCLKPAQEVLDSAVDSVAEVIASIVEGIRILFFILLWIAGLCLALYILRAFVHFLIY